MVQAKNEGYLGNNLIKRAGVETKYTEEEIAEYQKCSEDPCHFIENYCQIISLDEGLVPFTLRGYQEKLINHFNDHRFSVVLAARQSVNQSLLVDIFYGIYCLRQKSLWRFWRTKEQLQGKW